MSSILVPSERVVRAITTWDLHEQPPLARLPNTRKPTRRSDAKNISIPTVRPTKSDGVTLPCITPRPIARSIIPKTAFPASPVAMSIARQRESAIAFFSNTRLSDGILLITRSPIPLHEPLVRHIPDIPQSLSLVHPVPDIEVLHVLDVPPEVAHTLFIPHCSSVVHGVVGSFLQAPFIHAERVGWVQRLFAEHAIEDRQYLSPEEPDSYQQT